MNLRHLLVLLLLIFGLFSTAQAQLTWEWSFDGEAGTFTTEGNVADLASPNDFAILSLSVTESALPTNEGVSFDVTADGPQVSWNGSEVVGFSSATQFFGAPFQLDLLNSYFFGAGPGEPLTGQLTNNNAEEPLAEGPLAITPPPAGPTIVPLPPQQVPISSPLAMFLYCVAMLLAGFWALRRGWFFQRH